MGLCNVWKTNAKEKGLASNKNQRLEEDIE